MKKLSFSWRKKNPTIQTTYDLLAQQHHTPPPPHHHPQHRPPMSKTILLLVAATACACLVGTTWLIRRRLKTKSASKKRPTSTWNKDNICPPLSMSEEHAVSGTTTSASKTMMIPFVVYGPNDDDDKSNLILYKNLQHWQEHNHGLLLQLSRAIHTVQFYESSASSHHHQTADYTFLMDTWRTNLEHLAHVLEEETALLQQHILKPFETVRAISDRAHFIRNDDDTAGTASTIGTASLKNEQDDHSYNEAGQVVAHLVRDWTTEGRTIRANLYDWCCQRVATYHSPASTHLRIVVPGAGVGRLAWELATATTAAATTATTTTPTIRNHDNKDLLIPVVEAVESSWSMAAAAAAILQRHTTGQLRPYAADHWANQIHSHQRYDTVSFPDTNDVLNRSSHGGGLSYTIADFVQLRSIPGYKSHFDVVVTCFFIDTAVNILDYVDTIRVLLKEDGLWVNVGPLQWHRQSRLPVSADELKQIVLVAGFDILEWGVDITPVEYRNSQWSDQLDQQATGGTTIRSTHYDAYCPLRFVVRLTKQ